MRTYRENYKEEMREIHVARLLEKHEIKAQTDNFEDELGQTKVLADHLVGKIPTLCDISF